MDGGVLLSGDVYALINYMSQILVELVKLANTIVLVSKALACAGRMQSVLELEPECLPGEGGGAGRRGGHRL